MKKIICLILIVVSFWSARPAMAAVPMLKFTPSSGTYTNGSTFTVTVGVDSGTEKSSAVDIWGTFDSTKLELVSIDMPTNPAYSFTLNKNISDGKFDIYCPSNVTGTYEETPLNGDMAVLTFRAKAVGTAVANFTCQTGSDTDSNILTMQGVDLINCSANQNGSYTITDGGSSSTVNPTAVPTSASSASTQTQSSTLPQTGNVATTIGLLVFGLVGVLSSWALRFL
ncbi:hypothetical protein KBB48_02340 [Candidatus Shapirobacteria bacterium]|nr:hypothetical protein [Candidatus Shapirobacteria bacterium]